MRIKIFIDRTERAICDIDYGFTFMVFGFISFSDSVYCIYKIPTQWMASSWGFVFRENYFLEI